MALPHNQQYLDLIKSYLNPFITGSPMSDIVMRMRTASVGLEYGPLKTMLTDFSRFIIRVEQAVERLKALGNRDNEISIPLSELGIKSSYKIEFFYIAKAFIQEAGLYCRFIASDTTDQLQFVVCRVQFDESAAEREVLWMLGVYTDENFAEMNEFLLTLPVPVGALA